MVCISEMWRNKRTILESLKRANTIPPGNNYQAGARVKVDPDGGAEN